MITGTNTGDYHRKIIVSRGPDHQEELIVDSTEAQQKANDICHAEINKQIQVWKEMGYMTNAERVSDGYHTFQELYDMRFALSVALFRQVHLRWAMYINEIPLNRRATSPPNPVWKSRLHSDGTMFEGMFIVGLHTTPGHMITFHYHDEHWDTFSFADVLATAPQWDGHTDKDVIKRLLAL